MNTDKSTSQNSRATGHSGADSRLQSRAVQVQLPAGGLSALLPGLQPTGVWLREGQGMIGLGSATSAQAHGTDRFEQLARFWNELEIDDDATATPLPGRGPVAFTALAFSADSQWASRLIVPELLLGEDEHGAWLRMTGTGVADVKAPEPDAAMGQLLNTHGLLLNDDGVLHLAQRPGSAEATGTSAVLRPGHCSEDDYLTAVAAGVQRITADEVDKLVLARDVVISTPQAQDPGALLARLAGDYADCWTYWVGGGGEAADGAVSSGAVLGATPEMLVRLRGEEVSSRVLAGTVDRSMGAEAAAAALVGDAKQTHEHRLAVESLVRQLAPVTSGISAPDTPQVLSLPNVYHLATDVRGLLARGENEALPSPLEVAALAHPTAAVCGTPTAESAALIAELEGMDRGPYAGPVGWLDRAGNADFGLALRGAAVEGGADVEDTQLRLFAGCGIVRDSVPAEELAETHSKLRPMLTALDLL